MDKILITGNLGYNGVWVTKFLNEKGYYTIGLDTHYYQSDFFDYKDFLPDSQIIKDIRKIEEKDLENIDAIVHLAALSNDALGEIDSKFTHEINKEATVRFAKIAKKKGVKKFIYASSCSVYGIQSPNDAANEDFPLNPLTAYAKSKVESELELKKLHEKSFKVIIMRNATMHGLSPKLRLDLVVNNLVAYAHIYNKVKILSDGTPWRPLLSVVDFANAVLAFLENNVNYIIYNIGFNQENCQIKEIGEIISEITGAKLEINPNKTPDERSYKVDFSRFCNEFSDFKMEMSVRDTVGELFKAYKKYNLKEEDFLGSKYFRVRCLKELLGQGKLTKDLLWNTKK